jgi:uncharacterized protein (TIGR00299 family) protein
MIAYLDMPSGISGDMLLGCLSDAGWPLDELQQIPARLGLPADACVIQRNEVVRGALRATAVTVDAPEQDTHRHLSHIEELIGNSDLSQPVKDKATAVFRRLARAEARVHGTTVEQIHFHEVGAVDAIVDIVGVCAGMYALGIDELYASSFPLGGGWTNSAHGRIPLPAPATLELLAEANAPTRPAPGPGELVTPTGAALICELAEFGQPALRLSRIAVGAGAKEFDWPNVARMWFGTADRGNVEFAVLETNIDDMNPELYQPVREALVRSGALDVWTTSVQMKKGRPGTVLSVLAPVEIEQALSETMIQETTTLGVRAFRVHRYEASRTFETINTEYGPVRVKLKWAHGVLLGAKPEYDDCVRLAAELDIPARIVVERAHSVAQSQFGLGVVGKQK